MADEKPVTIPNLIVALKEAGFATKADLITLRDEVKQDTKSDLTILSTKFDEKLTTLREQVKQDTKDILHDQLTSYHDDMVAPEFEKLHSGIGELKEQVKTEFTKVDRRLSHLEADVSAIKDDAKGLSQEFWDTPRRKDFEALKRRVDKYHPVN